MSGEESIAEEGIPLEIEIVSADDVRDVSVVAKATKDGVGLGIAEKADALLDAAADILNAAQSANLYKVEVPKGYSLQDLVASSKGGGTVRAIVKDSRGKINGNVSLKAVGVNPAQIATIGLAAAAAVVGQAYMAEISDSLHRIDAKLDTVVAMIAGEQKAKVKNAIDVARTYADLREDYASRPPEALQAARNEIESRYNDVGEVIDWIIEQLGDIERRAVESKAKEDDLSALIGELRSYDEQFALCLQALSALGMTRMYYDGCADERGALVEKRRVELKSAEFFERRQRLAGVMELRIGAMKGAPIAVPKGKGGNVLRRLTSQTPRAAAKERLLEAKTSMQSNLRGATSNMKEGAADCSAGMDRIASANRAAHTMLTDGTTYGFVGDEAAG